MTWFILLTRKQWNISYPLRLHCTKTICFLSIGNYLQESMPVLHSLLSHANPHNKHQGSNSSHVRNWRQWSEGQCCSQKKIKIRNSAELLKKSFREEGCRIVLGRGDRIVRISEKAFPMEVRLVTENYPRKAWPPKLMSRSIWNNAWSETWKWIKLAPSDITLISPWHPWHCQSLWNIGNLHTVWRIRQN